jgi:hypothetical protein
MFVPVFVLEFILVLVLVFILLLVLGPFCMAHSFSLAGEMPRAAHDGQESGAGVHSLRGKPMHRIACQPATFIDPQGGRRYAA